MRVLALSDPGRYADLTAPVLAADPIGSNLLATLLDRARDGRLAAAALWLCVQDADAVIAAAVRTPPRPLLLAPPLDRAHPLDAVARALAGYLHEHVPELPGVHGYRPEATAFARAWQACTGQGYREEVAMRAYQADQVTLPAGVPGSARAVAEADLTLCLDWLAGFRAEATPGEPGPADPAGDLRGRIRNEWVLLWQDGDQPVSLAGVTRPVAGVSRIGPVYTPPRHRGHGYASALTAAATRFALTRGAHRCMLYTDLGNPTSNSIYQRIGYRSVADAVDYRFEP